jgi:hypothetical protein
LFVRIRLLGDLAKVDRETSGSCLNWDAAPRVGAECNGGRARLETGAIALTNPPELTLDDLAGEAAVLRVYRQVFAVLAREAGAMSVGTARSTKSLSGRMSATTGQRSRPM